MYYSEVFCEGSTVDSTRWFPRFVIDKMIIGLYRLPIEEEVQGIIYSMDSDKSPRCDVHRSFIKHFLRTNET